MAIYNGKHVVFEQVGLDDTTLQRNSSSNTDNDGCSNDWNISDIRTTHLPTRLLLLSSILQSNLTNTTIQTATNGINGTLVSTSDKVFIPAEKEMVSSASRARAEENSALTTWNYWTTHTTNADRIKYDTSSVAQSYFMRSAYSGQTNKCVYIDTGGGTNGFYDSITNYRRVALCYAF